jgi:hypothetical protein
MIARAAVRCVSGKVIMADEGKRHDQAILRHYERCCHGKVVQGFVTDDGVFLTRQQAATHAFECGQINEPAEIIVSEDLW